MSVEEWTQVTFRKGVFGTFVVHGFKYRGPHGETGWHTTSWPNENPIHDFWVTGTVFHQIFVNIFDPQFGGRNSFAIGEIIGDVDPIERNAVLEAIDGWEKPDQEIQAVIEEEIQRLPSNAHSAFEGASNDLTIGSDGQRKGVKRPDNPDDRFD